MFALVDCNNFYASCERLFRPDLVGKPIVVLSNNDGCVIARSQEAKDLGIKMGAPAFLFDKLFKDQKVHVFSSNYALYGDISARVMNMLSSYTPDIEVYSIDESFLRFDGFDYFSLQEIGRKMRQQVTQGTGIPISVGFAPTKALAKMANKIAKKRTETGGVFVIDTREGLEKEIAKFTIDDVWGIGPRHFKMLQAMGIRTVQDFTRLPDAWVKKQMSVVGLRLKHELQGIRTLDLEDVKPKQNIAVTRSFNENYDDYEWVKERVITFATICAERLRKQDSCCNVLQVFLLTNSFRPDQPQYTPATTVKLPYPTNSGIELAHFAEDALKRIYKSGFGYKKAGVVVMEFTPAADAQLMIFNNSNPKHGNLMAVVDKFNHALGQQKVKLASQDLDRVWKMKRERLSPRYTTRMSEIVTIKS
ncbi:SOS mutagenesis and repair protein UmuC [Dyadobacter luteus]|uniref:SOS mutagenesis and repair protein UmuC n=1 Tax=Dyadobacter luteus TaxID=2259619 RepID=A0A3D8Y655_9BACT|nr:Y-family DNA polymerase [Dyadobacter luteus]REA58177.1 SOS mutagenesis and repair protein UmuC [Dyadobacter luteus]